MYVFKIGFAEFRTILDNDRKNARDPDSIFHPPVYYENLDGIFHYFIKGSVLYKTFVPFILAEVVNDSEKVLTNNAIRAGQEIAVSRERYIIKLHADGFLMVEAPVDEYDAIMIHLHDAHDHAGTGFRDVPGRDSINPPPEIPEGVLETDDA